MDYPKIKYQGVPVAPNTPVGVNPGYIYAKVADADAEKALEGDWSDTPGEAIKSVKAGAKLTPAQYALMAAQATERGYTAPAPPKWDDEPAPASTQAHPAQSPAAPAAPPAAPPPAKK